MFAIKPLMARFITMFTICLCLLSVGSVWADPSALSFQTDDLTQSVFKDLFGFYTTAGGQYTTIASSVVMTLLKWFNVGLLAISGLMIGYASILGTVYTATEGRSLGQKIGNSWVVLRTFFSMGLMVPMTGGLSGIQLLIIWLVYQGTYIADHMVYAASQVDASELVGKVEYVFSGNTPPVEQSDYTNALAAKLAKTDVNEKLTVVSNQIAGLTKSAYCHQLVSDHAVKGGLKPIRPIITRSDDVWSIQFVNGKPEGQDAFFSAKDKEYAHLKDDLGENFDCGQLSVTLNQSGQHSLDQLLLAQVVFDELNASLMQNQRLASQLSDQYLRFCTATDANKTLCSDQSMVKSFNAFLAASNAHQLMLDNLKRTMILEASDLIRMLAQYSADKEWQTQPELGVENSWIMAAITLQTMGVGKETGATRLEKDLAMINQLLPKIDVTTANTSKKDDDTWVALVDTKVNLISQGIKNIITPQQKGKVPTTVQQTTKKALNSTLLTLLSHSGVQSLLDPQTPETPDTSPQQWANKTRNLRNFLANSVIYRENLPSDHLKLYEDLNPGKSYKDFSGLSLNTLLPAPGMMFEVVSSLTAVTGTSIDSKKGGVKVLSQAEREEKTYKIFSSDLDNALEVVFPQGYASLYDDDVGSFAFHSAKLWLDTFVVNPQNVINKPIQTLSSFGKELYTNALSFYMNASFDVIFSGYSVSISTITKKLPELTGLIISKIISNNVFDYAQSYYVRAQNAYADIVMNGIKLIPIVGMIIATIAYVVLIVIGIITSIIAMLSGPLVTAINLIVDLAFVKQFATLTMISSVAMPIFTVGAYCAFFIPLMPILYYFLGILGWLLSIVEAVVCAPFILLGMAHPVGHDLLGRAQMAMMMLISVFIRPITIVLGLIFAMILISVGMYLAITMMVPMINMLIDDRMAYNDLGNGIVVGMMMLMFVYLMIRVISMALSLIFRIPSYINRWIGLPIEESLQEDAEMISDRVLGGFGSVGGGANQMAQQGQQSGSATKGIMARTRVGNAGL